MSEQELLQELAAQGLTSNFGGDDISEIVMESYSGDGDLTIDFGDSASGFAGEAKTGRKYTMKFVNTTGVDKTIVMFPAYYDTDKVDPKTSELVHTAIEAFLGANFAVDAVAADGDVFVDAVNPAKKITVTSPDFKIRDFIGYAKFNTMRVTNFIVEANDKSVFPDYIRQYVVNPFSQAAEKKIPITDYLRVENNQDKKINVPESLIFGSSSLIIFKMPGLVNGNAYSELKFVFNIGAIVNSSITLEKKAQLAKRNITKAAIRAGKRK